MVSPPQRWSLLVKKVVTLSGTAKSISGEREGRTKEDFIFMGLLTKFHLLISYCVTVLSEQASVLLITRREGRRKFSHRLTKRKQQTVWLLTTNISLKSSLLILPVRKEFTGAISGSGSNFCRLVKQEGDVRWMQMRNNSLDFQKKKCNKLGFWGYHSQSGPGSYRGSWQQESEMTPGFRNRSVVQSGSIKEL